MVLSVVEDTFCWSDR